MTINQKLLDLNINIPYDQNLTTIASYQPFKVVDNLVYVSGQLPRDIFHSQMDFKNAGIFTGLAMTDQDIENGQYAAKLCAIQILYVMKSIVKDLDLIKSFIKLEGFVASSSDFNKHHMIINGASDFIGDLFDDKGRHARAAVGVSSLPLNAMVEIAAIIQI